MKFVALCLLSFVLAAKAQFDFDSGFGSSFGGFGGSFGSFGNGLDAPIQATRDPRQNPGPVVFPPSPEDNGETSGVVVGASGYGFVPPNSPRLRIQPFHTFF